MDKNYIKFKALYYWSDEDNCYYAEVPSFESVFTDGDTVKDLETNLVEIMTLAIQCFIDDKEDYAKMLKENEEFENKDNDKNIMFVSFFLPYEISKTKDIYKKKTLTIPVWLDILASQKNINFSRILQEGLKKELKIN